MRVGFVGLGTMGAAMAANVARAGFRVSAWNRTPGRASELLELGVRLMDSPAAVAGESDVVVSIVSDTPDVEAVLFGPGGVAEGAARGTLVVDMSTTSPSATRAFAARLAPAPRMGHDPEVTSEDARFDSLIPAEMAARAERVGVRKAHLDVISTFALSVLAGAFIALGAIFATTVAAGAGVLPFGIVRLIAGIAFSLGLILVIVGGAELFTGNTLIVMAWASRKVSTGLLLRNWLIVYAGNFVGAVGTAAVVFVAGQYLFGGGSVGLVALTTGNAKAGLDFVPAFALGMLCNALVCLAVWLTFSARTTTDRILAIVPPIAAFVASGFEHSIANMYFIPIAMLIRAFAPDTFWAGIGATAADYPNLTMSDFLLGNLLPVTMGNIVGGALMVGIVYWFIYLRTVRDRA